MLNDAKALYFILLSGGKVKSDNISDKGTRYMSKDAKILYRML